MLPALLAQDTRDQLVSFLESSFSFRDPAVWDALQQFLEDPGEGLFKGPYLSLELPYRKAPADSPCPLDISPPFLPYQHQADSWSRLASARSGGPLHTLVTTGTSSGKTECFLYPLIDHCWRERRVKGIKAIILYPMNALATDQAKRFAQVIAGDAKLRGALRVGMYVGGQRVGDGTNGMSETEVITNRERLRDDPPDILLTNYKMLDLLLLRPEDRPLWQHQKADSLRYLVVDELHTFDGAQGAEVACLIRRLRSRLGTPDGGLCCIGTSATLAGDGDSGKERLAQFATNIFGSSFTAQDIVGETRLSLPAYLELCEPHHHDRPIPRPAAVAPAPDDTFELYVQRVSTAWFGHLPVLATGGLDSEAIGRLVQGSDIFSALLRVAVGRIQPLSAVAEILCPDLEADRAGASTLLASFLALVAESRWRQTSGDPLTPTLAKSQVQIWIREMSRLGRVLAEPPTFRWLNDETADHPTHKALPPWFCHECGESGWLAVAHENDRKLTYDRRTIYDRYFEKSKHIRYLMRIQRATDNTIPEVLSGITPQVCSACCWFGVRADTKEGLCPSCAKATMPLLSRPAQCKTIDRGTRDEDTRTCPSCGAIGRLAIVGSQSSSLAAIALGHLYSHPLNRQPKLLAFTDSVQDASHRAGFFQARTYRFGLRTAVARYLHATKAQPLDGLADRLLTWWQSQAAQTPASIIANLTPPDLADYPDYADSVSERPSHSRQQAMLQVLSRRLQWDIQIELGLNSRRGRTLEKAAVLHVQASEPQLVQIADRIAYEVSAEVGLPITIPPDRWRQWLRAVVTKVRMSGGIWHDYAIPFAKALGEDFLLARTRTNLVSFRDELPAAYELPLFPASPSNGTTILPFGVIGRQQETWLTDFTRRWASPQPIGDHFLEELSRRALSSLTVSGFWKEMAAKGDARVWGWDPSALVVCPDGVQVRCSVCNHHLTVGEAAPWLGSTCLTPKCPGTYQAIALPERTRADFYRRRYLSGTIRRIFAHEHTGLLPRGSTTQPGSREWVESQFIASGTVGARADALNLLTCTSTMEMGINIGDLSSTMLCSVPPTTASYLQRIGRAGRGTGAALIVSMATNNNHDQHFFSNPLAMMAGAVDTPGCFLDAPDVIRRHFLAWCIDALVRDGVITADTWPRMVRDLSRQWESSSGALVTLHETLSRHQSDWESRFRTSFGPALSELGWQKLHPLVQAPKIHQLLKRAADAYDKLRQDYVDRLRSLRKERDLLKKVEKGDDHTKLRLDDLGHQIRAIELRRKDLGDRNTWHFLTDLGILPNYAFPEEGVRLNAEVYFPREWGRDPDRFEWVRGAAEAIRDLAPGNTFYAQRRRFDISRVEMGPPDNPDITHWRFCSRCKYIEEVKPKPDLRCPECQASDWRDLGRLRSMHKLRAVASTMDHFKSQASDDSDDRRQKSFQIENFFSIEHNSHVAAWAEDQLPFGFELLGQVTLRQVNLGPASAFAVTATIAGQDLPAQGYRVCAYCGVVEDGRHEPDPRRHQLWCLGRANKEQGEDQPWRWHGGDRWPYLYRELVSEALRLLLPVGILDSENDTVSFTAALALGLRLRFGGNPDHLLIRSQEQPIGDSGAIRTYLLIFDQVPGGTGYLRELARPDVLRDCLERSLKHLLACECRTPVGAGTADPDLHPAGCYKCLLSYAVSHQREQVRRESAIDLLDRILKRWHALVAQPKHSLGDVPDTILVESALERKFLLVLKKAVELAGGTWRDDLIGGKSGVTFALGERSWKLEPQVLLGPSQGVTVPCEADFLLRPVASRPEQLPVAVFLDGYRYHVCKSGTGASSLPADLSKRAAVRDSQRFLVWSMTWKDLDDVDLGQAEMSAWFDTHRWKELTKYLGMSMAPLPEFFDHALNQLVAYLKRPHVGDWSLALGRYLAFTSMAGTGTTGDKFDDAVQAWRSTGGGTPNPLEGDGAWRFVTKPAGLDLMALIGLHTTNLATALTQQNPIQLGKHLRVILRLHDPQERREHEEAFVPVWRRFQALANLLQFLSGAVVTTSDTNDLQETPPSLASMASDHPQPESPWVNIERLVNAPYKQLAQHLAQTSIPLPKVGFELIANDEVTGMAELAWPISPSGIAMIIGTSSSDAVAFADQGWVIIDADAPDVRDQILAAIQHTLPKPQP